MKGIWLVLVLVLVFAAGAFVETKFDLLQKVGL